MYVLGTSPSTQQQNKQTFSTPKFADKERRQNTLTKLVTKFSTWPLWRPPRQNFPPRKQTKNPKLSRLSEKHHQNKNSFLGQYSTKFHSTIVKKKSIPIIVNIFDTIESLFDFDYWIPMLYSIACIHVLHV